MTHHCRIDVSLPFGNAAIETTDRGVVSVRFVDREEIEILPSLPSPEGVVALSHAQNAARELTMYFEKKLRVFTTPVDLSWTTLFLRDILTALMKVPFGRTVSYNDLAKAAMRPRASRAVGGAMARNRALIFVPCHRVIASNGSLGGWSGPSGFKEKLLSLEEGWKSD